MGWNGMVQLKEGYMTSDSQLKGALGRQTQARMGLVKQNGSSENLQTVVVANSNTEGQKSSHWAKKSMHFKLCNHSTSQQMRRATLEFHQFEGGNHPKVHSHPLNIVHLTPSYFIHLPSGNVCHS